MKYKRKYNNKIERYSYKSYYYNICRVFYLIRNYDKGGIPLAKFRWRSYLKLLRRVNWNAFSSG